LHRQVIAQAFAALASGSKEAGRAACVPQAATDGKLSRCKPALKSKPANPAPN